MRTTRLILAVAVMATLTACSTESAGDERPHIVATTSVWADVVAQMVGDDATVETLIPRGSDSHDYRPTSRQVASIQEADLIVANGLGLEEGLLDVLANAAADGANVLEIAPGLDPLPFAGRHQEEPGHEEEETEGDTLDPHVWFDLTRVGTAAELIAGRLSEIDDSADWESRAREYSAELLSTHQEVVRTLDAVPDDDRRLVTNHDALGYFAAQYGFDVIAVVIPGGSTLGDPSSADLAALVEEISHEGVRAIFAETTQPTRLAEAVAAEVGADVEVVELYTESLGEPGSGADTLAGMILTNARLIANALSP